MGGAFIIHYIATALAIFLAVSMKVYNKESMLLCKKRPSAESEPAITVSNQGAEARETWQNNEDESTGPAQPNGSRLDNDDGNLITHRQLQEMNTKLAALAQQNESLSLQNAEILERLQAVVYA
jgi:hypothetical protein